MVLARNGNSKYIQDELLSTITGDYYSPVFYSLLIDESNDRGVEAKDMIVLIRFFDEGCDEIHRITNCQQWNCCSNI